MPDRSRRSGTACGVLLLALLLPAAGHAQVRVWVDAFASTAQPPADVVDEDASTYGLGGLRLERLSSRSYLEAVLQGGSGARNDDGRWYNAGLYGARHWLTGGSTLSIAGESVLLRYTRPFRYTARAISLQPRLFTSMRGVDVEFFGNASLGRWSTRYAIDSVLPPQAGEIEQVDEGNLNLVQFGSAAGIGLGAAATMRIELSTTRATNGSADGWYHKAEAGVFAERGLYQAHIAARLQRHGDENEAGFAITVQREFLDHASVHASLTRTVRDPQLATPGQLGFTIGVSVPLFARDDFRSVVTPIAEVVGSAESGRRVRFTVRAPDTERVQLVGSFTDWQPTTMRRDGDRWTAELLVPKGSHQFAFLLDGKTWFVPDDAPGVVNDGFGRRNATLIVS